MEALQTIIDHYMELAKRGDVDAASIVLRAVELQLRAQGL